MDRSFRFGLALVAGIGLTALGVVLRSLQLESGLLAWLTGTLASAVVGLIAGAMVAIVVGLAKPLFGTKTAQ
jgi:predicted DNA repair protein MutK